MLNNIKKGLILDFLNSRKYDYDMEFMGKLCFAFKTR